MTDFDLGGDDGDRDGRPNIRKELKAAVRLHSYNRVDHSSESADKRTVVRFLVMAGFTHHEIAEALDELLRNGELYEPRDGEVAVV